MDTQIRLWHLIQTGARTDSTGWQPAVVFTIIRLGLFFNDTIRAVVLTEEFETWASMTDRIQCSGCDPRVPADDSAVDSGQFFSIVAVGEPPPDHLTVIAPTNGAELPLNGHLIR